MFQGIPITRLNAEGIIHLLNTHTHIMKFIILLSIYLLSFVGIYMMMSLVGLVFTECSYLEILRSDGWTGLYCLVFGSWLPFFPAREYYLLHERYFDKLF